jgi:hypothetical protein
VLDGVGSLAARTWMTAWRGGLSFAELLDDSEHYPPRSRVTRARTRPGAHGTFPASVRRKGGEAPRSGDTVD